MTDIDRTNKKCPACGIGRLNFHCGDYGTGVFAPDGYQETVWEEFFQCNQCQETFDPSDINQVSAATNKV